MKRSILVLAIFIFAVSCLVAAGFTNSNRIKPMSEENYAPVSAGQLTQPVALDRENFMAMDFTGLVSLPTGWTVDNLASHWAIRQTNLAGGVAPELRFDWSPTASGVSRFISPVVDLTGLSSVSLEFMHSVDHYASPYTIGVATRSNNGAWNDVWTLDPTDMVDPELKQIIINNADVGSSTFQVCFYFSGNTYNINDWYIDNIRLFTPWQHDVKVESIDTNVTYAAGTTIVPPVIISNIGTASETFNVNCEIQQFETVVYSQTISMSVAHGQTGAAAFPPFRPMAVNETYKVVVQTSLEGDQDTANDTMTKYFNTFATERQKVVVEIGTGTWCTYCPGAAMGADDLMSNGMDVAVVEYHNGDTFVNNDSNTRNTYYNITGFPTAVFDGQTSVVGGNHSTSMYATYLPIYENAIPLMTPFYIALNGAMTGTTLNINATVNRYARITSDPLVLHFAVTESDIQFAWQGQTELNFVERAMAPNSSGTPLDIANVDVQTIPLSVNIDPTWNTPNLALVAFIQNPVTKVIYQGFEMPLIDLVETNTAYPPQVCTVAHADDPAFISVSWAEPAVTTGLSGYLIYRDGNLIYTKTHLDVRHLLDPAIPGEHAYYVKALFGSAVSEPSNSSSIIVANSDPVAVPAVSRLLGSSPNPFSSSTSIRYEMVKGAKVSLAVYNVKGQLVRTLENATKAAGTYQLTWDGKDENGKKLASGLYLYRFNTGSTKQVQKAVLIK